jgi:hypothetical protein
MTDDTSDPKSPEEEARRKANMKRAGIGIGIGSAAVVAALLFANKDKILKKKDKPAPEPTD